MEVLMGKAGENDIFATQKQPAGMSGITYMSRLCDTELQLALQSSGAVLIEGAKWCGKTSTANNASGSVLYMQDPDHAGAYQAMADTKPSLLLKGETPRLIDEWQMAPAKRHDGVADGNGLR